MRVRLRSENLRWGIEQLRICGRIAWHGSRISWGVANQTDLLEARIDRFTVRALRFIRTLPKDSACETLAKHLARAVCGASDNRRSARRARSRAEFVARLGVAVDEAAETLRWLELLKDTACGHGEELEWLIAESGELRAIAAASLGTARRNDRARRPAPK